MYEVHVRETPGRPRLAVVFGAAMLTVAIALCALFVREQRAFARGERLAPTGWAVSFEPPKGWERRILDPRLMPGYDGYRFIDSSAAGGQKELWIARVRYPGELPPSKVCDRSMSAFFRRVLGTDPLQTWALLRNTPIEAASLGPLPGVQAVLPSTGHLFRVGIVPGRRADTEAYLLEYHRAGPLNARDLKICEEIAASFE